MDYLRDRQLKIDLLKRAREEIQVGTPFICLALNAVAGVHISAIPTSPIAQVIIHLRTFIMEALDGQHTYEEWLEHHHPDLFTRMWQKGFLPGRLAWINWMIACYEEDIANYKKDTE